MQWSDEAIVLGVRPHGETAVVVETLTREHGRHLGLVHGGRSRKARPTLQIGNHVDVVWKARLEDQLGHMTIEPRHAFASEAMDDPLALTALTSMCALSRVLPEREPHGNLFEVALFVFGFLGDPDVWPPLMVRWELALLDDLGFGLDLKRCAATGATDDLIYVSPRTGRAVSRVAGEPYKDRLLHLPQFLLGSQAGLSGKADIMAGLRLTGHFLDVRIFAARGQTLPDARRRLADELARVRPSSG